MKKRQRALGWVQDAADWRKLKNIVNIFVADSDVHKRLLELIPQFDTRINRDEMLKQLRSVPITIEYDLLKGRGPLPGQTRATASCSGIAQAVLPAQNGRPYQSDWATNSFIVWAIALGLLEYDNVNDTCRLSALGKQFAACDNDERTLAIFKDALLQYPPVSRIITLLHNAPNNHLTKFEIGSNFGFIGEDGFTCYSQRFILEGIKNCHSTAEINTFLRNTEGTSDKYVRTICSWLIAAGWIQKESKCVQDMFNGKVFSYNLNDAYRLTIDGRKIVNMVLGKSRHQRSHKIISYSMLSPKAADATYLRQRRCNIIRFFLNSWHTAEQCVEHLMKMGINESVNTIIDDLAGFENIGINISRNQNNQFQIKDNLTICHIPQQEEQLAAKSDIEQIKDRLRSKLANIDHRYLFLIDLGFGHGKSVTEAVARNFELMTADLLVNELGFNGGRLGDSRKPDVCVFNNDTGLIIDNKAYSGGYSLPMSQADEMVRYIEENKRRDATINPNKWWEVFDDSVSKFFFTFISGQFTGGFVNRLLHIQNRTQVDGSVINTSNLLLLAENIKSNKISMNEALNLFGCLNEIII